MRRMLLLLGMILFMVFSTGNAQDPVLITQIEIDTTWDTHFKICWDDSAGLNPGYAEVTVTVNSGTPAVSTLTSTDIADGCVQFTTPPTLPSTLYNLQKAATNLDYQLKLKISLLLPLTIGEAEARFDAPEITTCQSADIVGTSETMLRLNCDKVIKDSDVLLADDNTIIDCSLTSDGTSTTYCFLESLPSTSNDIRVCASVTATLNGVEDKTIITCKKPIPVSAYNNKAPTVNTVELDYTLEQTTVSADSTETSDAVEVLHYWTNTLGNYEFSAVCSSLTCSTNPYQPGKKELNILLVGSAAPVVKESVTQKFQDYGLEVEFIFTSTLEMRWKPTLPGDSTFWITVSCDPTISIPFEEAEITCSSEASGCYGYFLDIEATPINCYPTLQPYDEGASVPIETNKITATIGRSFLLQKSLNELQIQDVNVTWQEGDTEASARVCFKYTSHNVTTSFSHYEFVLVNNKGKWLKHKLMTQDTEGDICFSPFVVNTDAFDVTEGATLVVTQRAKDGFTVLASGETRIQFARNL